MTKKIFTNKEFDQKYDQEVEKHNRKIDFLNRFDNFYQVMINAVKEDKVNERDFYALVRAKCKCMDRERRETVHIKVDLTE